MLRRGAVMLAGFVVQGFDFTAGCISQGVGRTVGLVSRGVDRVVADRAVVAVMELPGNTWSAVRAYVSQIGSAARCRARYRRITGPMKARYRDLKRAGWTKRR